MDSSLIANHIYLCVLDFDHAYRKISHLICHHGRIGLWQASVGKDLLWHRPIYAELSLNKKFCLKIKEIIGLTLIKKLTHGSQNQNVSFFFIEFK